MDKRLKRAAMLLCVTGIALLPAMHRKEAETPEETAYMEPVTEIRMEDLPTAGITAVLYGVQPVTEPVETVKTDIPTVETPETETEPEEESEPETETETEPGAEVDPKELDLLARLINAEVGGSKYDECLIACGSVVLNRVKDPEFPGNIHDVIYQTKPCLQYSVTRSGRINREPSERCIRIAEDLLRNGSRIPENVVYQSMKKLGHGVWKKIDKEYYCYK